MSSIGCLSLSARDCFSLRKMERSCTKPSCARETKEGQRQHSRSVHCRRHRHQQQHDHTLEQDDRPAESRA